MMAVTIASRAERRRGSEVGEHLIAGHGKSYTPTSTR